MISFFSENYISKYKGALKQEDCDYFIKKIDCSTNTLKSQYGNYIGLNIDLQEENNLLMTILKKIEDYKKKHKFLKSIDCRWGVQRDCNLQKYFPGDSYSNEHMEHGANEYDMRRVLAWMIYLNDIGNGGETCWPQQKYKSKARRGALLIWPAGWTHSHHGIVCKTETKYIITGWCSLYR